MNQKLTKIAISGAYGRMGTSLIQELQNIQNVNLQCCIVKKKKKNIICQSKKITIVENIEKEINNFDTLIDFSNTQNTMNNLKFCNLYNKNIVIGTTGFNEQELKIIKQHSKNIGIIFSYNFSIGMNLIFKLLKHATKILDSSYDIEILETHHRNKIDSPSGTALQIGNIISKYKKWDLNKCSIYRKKEKTNIRKKNKIGFSIIRGGNIFGNHKIMFLGLNETITISHTAHNRNTFAKGAIQASIWIKNKKKGLFSMLDVLNK